MNLIITAEFQAKLNLKLPPDVSLEGLPMKMGYSICYNAQNNRHKRRSKGLVVSSSTHCTVEIIFWSENSCDFGM
jgi:hypothetical protein